MHITWFTFLAVIILVAGCDATPRPRTAAMPEQQQRMAVDSAEDHLSLALDFIDEYHKYDERENITRISYHLNKWIESQSADDKWIADPMFARLPSRLMVSPDATTLTRLEFNNADIGMLREAIWLNNLAAQIAPRDVTDSRWKSWLEGQALSGVAARDLTNIVELFDWVIRNVQLESPQVARDFADSLGIDPPRWGAWRLPWESILLSRGDAWARAQVAVGIARQLNIPMIILGIDRGEDTRPWALAALIEGQLYLFDPRLGLPIPDSSGDGIATLNDVLSDPSILDRLSVAENPYPISAQDLARIVALIDAPLPYLTQKMWILQSALPTGYKLILSVTPSALAQELRKIPGITNVRIWPVPYDTMDFRVAHRLEPAFIARLDAYVRPFAGDNALANGRRQHIRGVFSAEPPLKGAKQYYLDCRLPDAALVDLKFTDEVKRILGIEGVLPEDESFMRPFRAAQTARLKFFKRHASYFLGLIALEEGKYEVAVDFLQTRTLAADPDGVFTDGAHYALARCYEQLGQLNGDREQTLKAIAILEEDTSPQAAGNRLRAAQLRRVMGDGSVR